VSSEDTRAALNRVSTATLTAQLARRGITRTYLRGLASTRPDLRLLGRAVTLRLAPLREDVARSSDENLHRAAVESIQPGDVLVIEARGELRAATLGDLLAARVLALGGAGVVTDGCIRDGAAIAALDLPVYHAGHNATQLWLMHHPIAVGVPVACADVLIIPGDVVVGDADGVMVVPASLAAEVADDALEQEAREALERQ
jgi:regulator of RNase E activity RraA